MPQQMDMGNSGHAGTAKIQKTEFLVSGLCEMCKDRIETAAKLVKGVITAIWDMETKQLKVEYNGMETGIESIQKAIAKAGHDTGSFKADDAVYSSLPDCCKYRE
jgi:Cu(I)/Ag(I) efflux system membrane fusion protein